MSGLFWLCHEWLYMRWAILLVPTFLAFISLNKHLSPPSLSNPFSSPNIYYRSISLILHPSFRFQPNYPNTLSSDLSIQINLTNPSLFYTLLQTSQPKCLSLSLSPFYNFYNFCGPTRSPYFYTRSKKIQLPFVPLFVLYSFSFFFFLGVVEHIIIV